MEKTEKRGGFRANSGRKKADHKKKSVSIRMYDADRHQIEKQFGRIQKFIDACVTQHLSNEIMEKSDISK